MRAVTNQNAVKDAVVIAQSPALQGEQTAVTDESGNFEITLLPAGVYRLTVQREGYQSLIQPGLTVRAKRTIRVKLQLVSQSYKGSKTRSPRRSPPLPRRTR